jgi:23S rRNA (pseudouridine1915-N3)-methyltransferase
MKLHLVTIGAPKLAYAQAGWQKYLKRLQRYHTIHLTHLADKWADDAAHILETAGKAYTVALVVDSKQLSTEQLAEFLEKRAMEGREICFIIGGPEGLPAEVIARADFSWSFSNLTFPHDLAMVILVETLYRASTVNASHPYHRA